MKEMNVDASNALKNFELTNRIKAVDEDLQFRFDEAEQEAIRSKAPWKADVNHFKKVRISAVALIKMVMHARYYMI